jgi:hypothetical protein
MKYGLFVSLIVVAAAGCLTMQAAGTRSTEEMLGEESSTALNWASGGPWPWWR